MSWLVESVIVVKKMELSESSVSLTGLFPHAAAHDPERQDSVSSQAEIALRAMTSPQNGTTALRIGLIDGYRFSQECLVRALAGTSSLLVVHPFDSVNDFLAADDGTFDLIIYYAHATVAWDAVIHAALLHLQEAARRLPLIVMSDIDEAQQSMALRSTMSSGARGFIPTRTTGMPITLAVIRFIRAGGVYAPLDLLLEHAPPASAPKGPPAAARSLFTARQLQVLALLRQGKANKNIAHDLSMSESTVKVHVRNIMRLTGASNRTQAAFRVEGWETAAGRS